MTVHQKRAPRKTRGTRETVIDPYLHAAVSHHNRDILRLKEELTMAKIPDFYSVNEPSKPAANRRYHNDDLCAPGRDIRAAKEDRSGTNGYKLCEHCEGYGKPKH
jgi:hypothetical protein